MAGTAGTAGTAEHDQLLLERRGHGSPEDWTVEFAAALTRTMSAAMDRAGGRFDAETGERLPERPWSRALNWLVSSCPLLGVVAAGLTVVADAEPARAHDIAVAAVDSEAGASSCSTSPPTTSSTAGCWRWESARCRTGCCTNRS